jgi:hypothetical protein
MTAERLSELSPRLQAAVDELQTLIQHRYPQATFSVSRAQDDPAIVHLNTEVDVADTEEVVDLVIGRMIELQVDEGLPVYVIPTRPLERILAERQTQPRTAVRGSVARPLS